MAEKQSIYANSVTVGVSQYDVTLLFQRISLPAGNVPMAGAAATVVAQEVDVILSHPHLKILAASLLETIAAIEKEQGAPIQLPAGLQDRFPNALKLFATPLTATSMTRQ